MAGIWDRLMEAVTSPSDDNITMIDGTSIRVHHLAATLRADHQDRCLGRSRGGLTTKIHAVTDGIDCQSRLLSLPVKLMI
jgi:hypothetical protein